MGRREVLGNRVCGMTLSELRAWRGNQQRRCHRPVAPASLLLPMEKTQGAARRETQARAWEGRPLEMF